MRLTFDTPKVKRHIPRQLVVMQNRQVMVGALSGMERVVGAQYELPYESRDRGDRNVTDEMDVTGGLSLNLSQG